MRADSKNAIRPATRSGLLSAMLLMACASASGGGPAAATADAGLPDSPAASCDMAAASGWIGGWLDAWALTLQEILRIPDAPPPDLMLFDATCLYTNSEAMAAGPAQPGPGLPGHALRWRVAEHHDSLVIPSYGTVPVDLMSFANIDKPTGRPYFVMAAPEIWERRGLTGEFDFTPVFLHEFAHTRQVKGMGAILGPIDDGWDFPEELTDDIVQTRFGGDSAYAAAYITERDLLYRAADAETAEEARSLAREALDMIRARRARWFVGGNAVFEALDDVFLSLEGAGQWAAYAWLAHPEGGGMSREAAIARMIGRRRQWTQDEGLALFLVVDRLVPDWPSLVFRNPSAGVVELLERAIGEVPG